MHDQICSFPSKTLCGSKLKSHPSVSSHLLHDLLSSNAQASSEEEEDDDEKKDLLQTPVVFFLIRPVVNISKDLMVVMAMKVVDVMKMKLL